MSRVIRKNILMKKISSIIILLFIYTSLQGQNSASGFFSGLNLSMLTGDSTKLPNRTFRYGARAGMFWDFNVKYNTDFEFGIFYSQQGVKYYHQYFDFNKEVYMKNINKIDYIQIPVVWKEHFGTAYTKIGIYSEIAANAKSLWFLEYKYRDSMQTYNGQYPSFVNSLRLYDIGAYFGAGFQFSTRKKVDILIEANFTHGFFPINEGEYSSENQMRNMSFNISAGLLFGKSKKKKYKSHRR